MSERREFLRVPLRVEIRLKGASELVLTTSTRDLSLRGVLISHQEELRAGQDCELCLVLGEGPGAARVEILGRVARCSPAGVGVEFLGIRGAESLDHLRRLVLHNAPDVSLAEEEIRRHRGLKRREE
jgi:hypothetical protein